MNAKTTTVTLSANGVTREFEFSHAERLLRMPNNGGWELPQESNYEFSLEDGLRSKRNQKGNKGA